MHVEVSKADMQVISKRPNQEHNKHNCKNKLQRGNNP